jgi:hypothetical protein
VKIELVSTTLTMKKAASFTKSAKSSLMQLVKGLYLSVSS